MADQIITDINEIDSTLDPVTDEHGLEMLGNVRDQPVALRRFSRSIFKIGEILKSLGDGKENIFNKNSGFNKNKSDSFSLDDSNTLATSKALKNGLLTKLETTIEAKDINGMLFMSQLSNDLNTIVDSGVYRISDSNLNMPIGAQHGQLLVLHGGNDTISQICLPYNSDKMYYRSGNPSDVAGSGSWRTWSEVYSTKNLPKPVDIGAAESGQATLLWSGSHYMDSGTALDMAGEDFSNYQLIVMYVSHTTADAVGKNYAGQLTCPTYSYGYRSYDWCDITGDDWCGAYLIDSNSIKPYASHGVYIRQIVGIR
ncbi:pyocin knob domain-containing protein [uncultured Ilyobacter sp.]|uniref:pyocin knob domain-containing protein n=1 Tax=uncultured Ilyobacter sp. TaxID=544433 RepID=UPI0029BFC110|nr:pyocin knob domain-containing protein [uncultured Ilyobacter sp.]